jgi:hypothetical protein
MSDRVVFDFPDVGNFRALARNDALNRIGNIVGWLEQLQLGDVEVVGRVPHHVSEHDSWLVQLSTV